MAGGPSKKVANLKWAKTSLNTGNVSCSYIVMAAGMSAITLNARHEIVRHVYKKVDPYRRPSRWAVRLGSSRGRDKENQESGDWYR